MDGRARLARAYSVRRALGAPLCCARHTRRAPGARPAYNETRAYCRARDTFYQPMVYNDIGGRARAWRALCVRAGVQLKTPLFPEPETLSTALSLPFRWYI